MNVKSCILAQIRQEKIFPVKIKKENAYTYQRLLRSPQNWPYHSRAISR